MITWSRHSRRIDPIERSTYPFCHGDRGAMGRWRMPIARSRRVNAWHRLLRSAFHPLLELTVENAELIERIVKPMNQHDNDDADDQEKADSNPCRTALRKEKAVAYARLHKLFRFPILSRAPHAVGGPYGFRSARNVCSRLQFVQTNISLCFPKALAARSISLSCSSPPHRQCKVGGGSTRGRMLFLHASEQRGENDVELP